MAARRSNVSDLDSKTTDWIQRALDETLRRGGRIRDLVLRMLAPADETTDEGNGWTTRVVRKRMHEEPTLEDLAAALSESPGEPIPRELVTYAARVIRGAPRKTGTKASARSTWEDIAIIAFYRLALHAARDAHKANGGADTRAVTRRAEEHTGRAFGYGRTTIRNIVAERSLTPSRPPK